MTNAIDPYAGYTVRIGDEYPRDVHYADNAIGTCLLRVHHRVSRTPSRREFVVRPLRGATISDRAEIHARIDRIRQTFRRYELAGLTARVWNRPGQFWVFYAYVGTPCDDPLLQLELEMMLDQPLMA